MLGGLAIKQVIEYKPLVISIAKKYANCGVDFNDLIQDGLIGVLEAQKRFDKSRRIEFTTYASYWIKKYILNAIKNNVEQSLCSVNFNDNIQSIPRDISNADVVIPENIPQIEREVIHLFINKRKTLRDIASVLNTRTERVRQIKNKALRRIRALNR